MWCNKIHMVRAAIGTVPLAENCRDKMILGTHPSCIINVVTRPICANCLAILVPQLPGSLKANAGRYRD